MVDAEDYYNIILQAASTPSTSLAHSVWRPPEDMSLQEGDVLCLLNATPTGVPPRASTNPNQAVELSTTGRSHWQLLGRVATHAELTGQGLHFRYLPRTLHTLHELIHAHGNNVLPLSNQVDMLVILVGAGAIIANEGQDTPRLPTVRPLEVLEQIQTKQRPTHRRWSP